MGALLFVKCLIKKQIEWLQDSILRCMHHHTLFKILFDMAANVHWIHIIWCLGLELTFRTILSMFCLLLDVFFTTLQIWLILPDPLITSFPHFEGIHLINHLGIHLLQCSHGKECTCMWCHLWCFCIHGKRNYFTFHVVWKHLLIFPSFTF